MDEIMKERYMLAKERIAKIPDENLAQEPFRDFFVRMAKFIVMVTEKEAKDDSLEALQKRNYELYEDILEDNYRHSYGNPVYAKEKLGEYGVLFGFLYTELRGMIVYEAEKRIWDLTVCMELFLEVYVVFCQEETPKTKELQQILYWYVSDYTQDMVERRIEESVNPDLSFATDIIMESDLSDLRYLYRYGEYVSENELGVAEYLNSLPQSQIDDMARTYTEGYRIGFINGRKDLSKKKTVNIRYVLGFERIVKAAILQFGKMGLRPTIYRSASHVVNKRQHIRIGYYGAIPNKQFEYDHRADAALFLDEDFVKRKLRAMQQSYKAHEQWANVHAGPACIEIFGEKPFVPEAREEAYSLSKKQQKLQVAMNNEAAQITNRYIKGEERSFTIIAFPVPEIGERFKEIFQETVIINTLDYKKYERIQQTIIETLDQGVQVHIQGGNGNRTDLTVALHPLEDITKQTNFENCVADVNIPVGEVFTSPQLRGTNGVLHVSKVYLDELQYENLEIHFADGKITEYSCTNFDTEEENRKYILENVLFHHDTLPLGEFAVGTNTTAYVMTKKYGIEEKLPILIVEKMGPHFAVGDTCYSWSEDTAVFNPDGREIIARDNEVSILRKEDPSKAYMGCHTDITIPYEELKHIQVVKADGSRISIIEDGRFVLPGTEELNDPFAKA